MTLADFINQYNGQYVGDHQCGALVRLYAQQVQGVTLPSYPSAKDYWFNSVPGYSHVTSPLPDDIAVYNAHTGFPDGHIAVYVDGRVFEQNADPDGSPVHLANRATTYLLGYLRKEENMNPNEGDVDNAYLTANKRTATPEEIAVYVNKPWNAPDGLYYGKTLVDLVNALATAGAVTKANVLAYIEAHLQ